MHTHACAQYIHKHYMASNYRFMEKAGDMASIHPLREPFLTEELVSVRIILSNRVNRNIKTAHMYI
jgi:hypothetical protein